MEQVNASPLKKSIEVKMSRRQLMGGLAVATSAAFVGSSVPAHAEGATGFRTTGINHISYRVKDYARARDFYSSLFGMKVSADDGTKCYLSAGDVHIVVQPGHDQATRRTPLIDHIAFSIANWNKDAILAELKRRGLTPEPEQMIDGRKHHASDSAYQIRDPDGFRVTMVRDGQLKLYELLKQPAGGSVPAPSGGKAGFKTKGINHISYRVADYRKTRDFFSGLFGMQVSADDGMQCHLAAGDVSIHVGPGYNEATRRTPVIDHIAYSIANWNTDAVLTELKRRGLTPEPEEFRGGRKHHDGTVGFQVKDPDGFRVTLHS